MADRKFTNLRKRLDQLGYRQALGIESVPLVEKLFTDLVHTTESLKNVKLQLNRREKEKTTFEDNAEPYRSDNAKLVRENNELHLQLIRAKEDSERAIRELKSSLRKLEHESADLKFLNTQYVHKVKALEKNASEKAGRISDLQEKNLHAVVETPGGRKKQIPTRRQRMDINSTLAVSDRSTRRATSSTNDPYVADLLNVADERIEELQGKIDELNNDRSAMERRNKSLRKQVENRDKEIDRLGQLLEGGRPVNAIMRDTKQDSSDKVVAHLNVQVDYLQQANKDLEKKLKETLVKKDDLRTNVADLSEENEQLLVKLKKLDKKKHAVEEQRDKVATIAVKDAEDAKLELKTVQRELEDCRREKTELRKEREQFIEECERLGIAVGSMREDKEKLEGLLQRCEEEKERLAERNVRLAASERELIMDIEKLRSRKSPKKSGREKSPSKLDGVVKKLEKERDYYKEECASLQEMVKKKLVDSATSSPKKKGKTDARWQSMLRIMEEERDYYKTEFEVLRSKKGKSPTPKDRVSSSTGEVARLRRERDDLQALLEKFERHLADIQDNVKIVVTDRDSVQLLYEQATEEIQRLRRQVTRSRSPSPSRTISTILSRVEAERDEAIADLRRASSEIEGLQEQLKVRTDSAVSERRRHQQSITDLESALEKLEKERREGELKIASHKSAVSELEEQLRMSSSNFVTCRDATLEKEAEANKMRLIAEQAERSVEDCQRQLARKNDDLRAADEKIQNIEQRADELEKLNSGLRQDIVKLRGTVKSLDIEKDNLQQQVDEKTERVMALDARRLKQDKSKNELKLNVDDLEAKLQHALGEVNQKQRELKVLRRDLESKEDDLGETTRIRDAVARENKRVQDDLVTMTAENQAIHQELEQSLQEQDTFKIQIRDYTTQVARFEELLAQKDQEKEELLEQFRALSSEAEKMVTDARVSEGQVNNYKTELRQRAQADLEINEKLRSLQMEVEQHIINQRSYELQLSNLTKSLQAMEEQLRQSDEEKEALLTDLSAVRELCVKLDQMRDSLSRQLASKLLDRDELQQMFSDAQEEVDALRSEVFREKSTVKNLEDILSNSRSKEYLDKKSLEETMGEVGQLRLKLSTSNNEKVSQRQELQTLRTTSERLASEVSELRKQLISEKYEKEKATRRKSAPGQTGKSGFGRSSVDRDHTRHTTYSDSEFTHALPRGRSSPLPSTFLDSRHRHDSIISPINHGDKEESKIL